MFALVSLAATLAAPPDPLAGLSRFLGHSYFVAVLHPAAVWESDLCAGMRKAYPADPAKPPAEADVNAQMAYAVADLCRPWGIASPAEVERIAVSGGGAQPTVLVTLRRPFDLAKLEAKLAAELGGLDDPFTRLDRGGVTVLRQDSTWRSVAILDGGRTVVVSPPPVIDQMLTAAAPPAAGRFLDLVRAGVPVAYFGHGESSIRTGFQEWLAGTGVSADRLKAATASVRFAADTTIDLFLDGVPPPADSAAAVKQVVAKFGPQLRAAIPTAAAGDEELVNSFLPFARAAADGFDKLAPLPAGPDALAVRMTVRGTPPLFLLSGFMGPMITQMVTSDQPAADDPGLQLVTKALLAYQAKHGTLPPAATRDAAGRPLLSWRVAVLPFLGDDQATKLHAEFRQDEPWDSDHNLTLLDRMPAAFRPRVHHYGEPLTAYQVFVGPGTAHEGGLGRATKDFADGPLTVLVGEGDRLVPWTKPQDQPFDPAMPVRGRLAPNGNFLDDILFVGLADGSVRAVSGGLHENYSNGPSQAERRRRAVALFSRAGGEPLTAADIPTGLAVRRQPVRPEFPPAGGM